MNDLIGPALTLIGLVNAGLCCAIWYRLGGLMATQQDHERRLTNLERRRAL